MNDATQTFREGLDATERECEWLDTLDRMIIHTVWPQYSASHRKAREERRGGTSRVIKEGDERWNQASPHL